MIEYNAINTVIHYFYRDGKRFYSFSVWVSYSGEVVKAPPKHNNLVGQRIGDVIHQMKRKGYQHEVID